MEIKITFLILLINQIVKSSQKSKVESDLISVSNKTDEKYDAIIRIYEQVDMIDQAGLHLTNISKMYLSDLKYVYTGKILYLDKYIKINKLNEDKNNLRRKWIFLFDSSSELLIFIENIKQGKLEYMTNAIIITEDLLPLITSKISNILLVSKIYSFYLSTTDFEFLSRKYNYDKDTEDIYIQISPSEPKNYNFGYLFFISYICLIAMLLCISFFKYQLKTDYRNYTYFFIRTIYFFPTVKFIITLLNLLKLKILSQNNDLLTIGSSSIVSFITHSLDIVYKSLFFAFSILCSKGIDATLKINSQREIILFLRKFLFMYIVLSYGCGNIQFLKNFPNFSNFISISLESIVFFLIHKNKKKNVIILIKKLNLAVLYCEEYVNSLKLKLYIIIYHFRIYCLYYILMLILYFYNLTYNLLDIEKNLFVHFIDVFNVFCICLIYRPRKWPENFEVDFKNDFNYFDNIFSCRIQEKNKYLNKEKYKDDNYDENKISETKKLIANGYDEKKNNKNDIEEYYTKYCERPIVIVNPDYYFRKNKENKKSKENKEDSWIKSIYVGYNKVFN